MEAKVKGLFQLEIISNVLVTCFWLILIHMWWVYNHKQAIRNIFTQVRGSLLDVRICRPHTADSDV